MKPSFYSGTLKRHGLTVSEISVMFGAKSEHTFRCSTAYNKRMKGICELIQKVEDGIIKRIKE